MRSVTFIRYPASALLLLSFTMLEAQAQVAAEAAELMGSSLDDAQVHLQENGYEIAGSSLFGSNQLWWNQETDSCVRIEFGRVGARNISAVEPGDRNECVEGVAAARAVWDAYHDGPSPVNSPALTEERSKLEAEGFVPTYWIDEAAPGRNMDVWFNESTNTCKRMAYNSDGSGRVAVSDCEPEQAVNPAPSRPGGAS